MDIKRLGLTLSLLLTSGIAYACPPVTAEQQTQRLQETLKTAKDLALVEVESDTYQEERPATTFAILKIRHGWGNAKKQLITYLREETTCGPPEKLEKDGTYLVVLDRHKVIDIFEYPLAKKQLKALGKPQYKYNKKGVLIKSPD